MAESAQDYSDDDPVVVQYENWAYPAAVADLTDPVIADYLATFQTLRNLSLAYWPTGQPRPDLDILVAGCGTRGGVLCLPLSKLSRGRNRYQP